MATSDAVKLAKMAKEARREEMAWGVLRTLIASPAFQLVGTVAVAEYAEHQGWLSGRWAGALEGGVIAMVGMQAYKEMGLAGLGLFGSAMIGGAGSAGEQDYATWYNALAAGVPPLKLLELAGVGVKK